MRDLDEALARLARRDKLQKRHTSGESDRLQNAVDDVTDTLRRLVERHRGLSVVARIEADDASTEIRVARDGGMVRVDRKDILSGPVLPPVNRHHSAADDPLFGPSPLTEPRFTDTRFDDAGYDDPRYDDARFDGLSSDRYDDARQDDSREPTVIDLPLTHLSDSGPLFADGPIAGTPFAGQTPTSGAYGMSDQSPYGDGSFVTNRSGGFPSSGPPEWPLRTEAAVNHRNTRLADLIRRDPTLLEGTSDR